MSTSDIGLSGDFGEADLETGYRATEVLLSEFEVRLQALERARP